MGMNHFLRGKKDSEIDNFSDTLEDPNSVVDHRFARSSFNHFMRGRRGSGTMGFLRGKKMTNHFLRGKKAAGMDHFLRGRKAGLNHFLRGKKSSFNHFLRGKKAQGMNHFLRGKKDDDSVFYSVDSDDYSYDLPILE